MVFVDGVEVDDECDGRELTSKMGLWLGPLGCPIGFQAFQETESLIGMVWA